MGIKWVAAIVVMAGCASQAAPVAEPGDGSPPELGSSLNVRVVEDTVLLELHVTNVASSPIELEFTTTQRYDFEIATRDGESVWRWSAARSFGQALGSERLEPGESRSYSASWPSGGSAGEFIATGWVVSQTYPVELRTGFRLPAE
ncbi:MAG TPA: BsuPI-related putative proteinase inhibitor [Longimicrobiales bacterium]|nr:BsuPI-related putative proteinase inhibitor [Longimicrobiales bacterium]